MKRHRTFTATAALAVALHAPAIAQSTAPARVLELNRSGEWSSAARLAEQLLESNRFTSEVERCEVMYNLAYARTWLRDITAARSALDSIDRDCASLPRGYWVHSEVARLRAEIDAALPVPADDAFWETADPLSMGLDAGAIEEHRILCEQGGADACLLVFKGKIVQEWYSPRYREPMYAMSTTKSITGLLVGMLVDDGRIAGLDQRVCAYVAEWCDGRRGRVTLRHLLTMTSGLPRMLEASVGYVADKNPYVIALQPAAEAGSVWAYSNEGVQLLSPILDEAAGEPIQEYAREQLFEPLGMRRTRLHLDEKDHAWTYADMETTPRDLARIGLMLLNGGVWQGRRIIGERWIDASTRSSQTLNPEYGLLWWLHDEPRGYAAHGHLDTHLHIFPGLELVAVRMQSRPVANVEEGAYERAALGLFARMIRKRPDAP